MPSLLHTLQTIIKKVDQSSDIQKALDYITESLIDALRVEVSSIFINIPDQSENLVLMSNQGFDTEAASQVRLSTGKGMVGMVAERSEPIRVEKAEDHRHYEYFEALGEEQFPVFLGVPIITHRKLLGVLVVQRKSNPFDNDDEAFLTTLSAQLANAIQHAEHSGNMANLLQQGRGRSTSCNLTGVAGSPGIKKGRAVVFNHGVNLHNVADKKVQDQQQILREIEIFSQAVDETRINLLQQAERMRQSLPEEECAIFIAYAQMLESGSLIEVSVQRIRAGNWAPAAWRETVIEHSEVFAAMDDEYLAERAKDIRDLGRRVLRRMMMEKTDEITFPDQFVLVGEDISAADFASLPLEGLQAIVSEHGSGSSHVAILAHALGIPAVLGVTNLPYTQMDGLEVVVDGYSGNVYVDPQNELLHSLNQAIREEEAIEDSLLSLKDKPALTEDGFKISLFVNSGLMADHTPSLRSGAEGVGLYRTEIPFQIRESFPSEDDQYQIYREVLHTFKGMPVVLRSLDVGGDKPLSYFPIKEDNPFLGWRGIRITLDHPDIFLTQVRAMIRANTGLNNLHIMLPMISGLQELDDALILIHRAKDEVQDEVGEEIRFPHVGAMIEVPSAIYQIDEICQLVDFVSIGTNDLTQYLLAVDRNNESVSGLFSAIHPSVLRAMQQVVNGAERNNTPVSVCGELAGDPIGVMILLGMGIDSLSMSVGSLLRAKKVIRSFGLTDLRQQFEEAINLSDAEDIREFYSDLLDGKGLGGLIRAGN